MSSVDDRELQHSAVAVDLGPNMDEPDFLHPTPQQPLLASPQAKKTRPRQYEEAAGSVQTRVEAGTTQISDDGSAEGIIEFQIAPRFGLNLRLSALAVNITLSVLTVITQVGMTVSLPMFSTALESHIICGQPEAVGDVYFLLLFTAFWFILFFGALILIAWILNPKFPIHSSVRHIDRVVLGFLNAINGILIVFSSPEDRTPVFLQPLLSTIIIPFTVLASYILLRKKEGIPRLICCLAVVVGLIIATEPVIFNIDGQGSSGAVHVKPVVKFAWSCVFMVGFVPLAINNVFEEKIVKRAARLAAANESTGGDKDVNALLLMFWINLWTFIMFAVMFWTDFIPVFGTVDGFAQFKDHMNEGFACMFGSAKTPYEYYVNASLNCTLDAPDFNPDPHCSIPLGYCWLFIIFYCFANLFSLMLIKYAAGAVYLVVVQGLITPLGAIFWYLFTMDDAAHVLWKPIYHKTASTFTLMGLLIMVPAVIAYNVIGIIAEKRNEARRFDTEPEGGEHMDVPHSFMH